MMATAATMATPQKVHVLPNNRIAVFILPLLLNPCLIQLLIHTTRTDKTKIGVFCQEREKNMNMLIS